MFKELKETMLKGLKEEVKIIILIKGLLQQLPKHIHLKTAPKYMKKN